MREKVFLYIVGTAFVALAVIFDTLPRSTYSPLEKRELATRPAFTWKALWSGEYTKQVSAWFSDTEPFRDGFMALSMQVKNAEGIKTSDENITLHVSKEEPTPDEPAPDERDVGEYVNKVTQDENAKIANKGIIIVGQGKNVRALMAYGGSANGATGYAEAANAYKKAFGPSVNVYCMVVPTAVEFYLPDKAKKCSNPELPTIRNIFAHLDPEVKAVDVYTALGRHVQEDIYLRTDHHWAPLGAYYAAQRFAHVAGVPFPDLSHYEADTVRGYVGTMYGYSKDVAVKNAPENFIYYRPRGVDYTTTYTDYKIDRNYKVVSEGKPYQGVFFYKYKDGSTGAYCTFMGGDTKITAVRTSTRNGRRVLILKDSFGNALPGYLFFSFEEVHVIDERYFTHNMRAYVRDNHITDILFANNIFKAYSPNTYKNYVKFLNQ